MKARRSFLTLVTFVIAVLMAVSAVLAPVSNVDGAEVNLGMYNFSRLPFYLFAFAFRFIVGTIVGLVLQFAILRLLGVRSLRQLKDEMAASYNDSHAILVTCMFVAAMILVAGVPFTSISAFLTNVVFRGGIATWVSTFGTFALAYVFGVRSLSEFESWVGAKDNDSYAILIGGLFVAVMIVAVFGR